MNIHSTLTCLFPAGVVVDCGLPHGDSLEVHGLPKGTVPQNCEVLASGRSKFIWGCEHQEIYLVKTEDYFVVLRIGPAGPKQSDGEFVVSRAYAPVNDELALNFQINARKRMEVLCGAPLSPGILGAQFLPRDLTNFADIGNYQ